HPTLLILPLLHLSQLPTTPPSTLFPSTTLFRSLPLHLRLRAPGRWHRLRGRGHCPVCRGRNAGNAREGRRRPQRRGQIQRSQARSEEHTSELQSRENLVCRLLLEKKKSTEITTW